MIGGKGGGGGRGSSKSSFIPPVQYKTSMFGMRTPIKPTKKITALKFLRGNPKVKPENRYNKGGAILGVGLGRAIGAVGKLSGKIAYGLGSTLARQGVSLGKSIGRSALRQGRATAKAYRKSAAKRARAKSLRKSANSLRNSAKQNNMRKTFNPIIQGRNNQNVGNMRNNVINNSSYKPFYNQHLLYLLKCRLIYVLIASFSVV